MVDVRYPNEWEAGHIEGAVHIPGDYIFDRVGELDPTRPVVTVCRSGSRSAEAAQDLASEGFDVQNLEGGIDAWVAEGLPIWTDEGALAELDPEPPPDDRPPPSCRSSRTTSWRPRSPPGTTSGIGRHRGNKYSRFSVSATPGREASRTIGLTRATSSLERAAVRVLWRPPHLHPLAMSAT